MHKYYNILLVWVLLSGCASAPDYKVVNNSDLVSLNDCDHIHEQLAATSAKINSLNKIQSLTAAGNAVAIGSALLSFNPISLFDIRTNGNLDEARDSYNERLVQLKEIEQRQCTGIVH